MYVSQWTMYFHVYDIGEAMKFLIHIVAVMDHFLFFFLFNVIDKSEKWTFTKLTGAATNLDRFWTS